MTEASSLFPVGAIHLAVLIPIPCMSDFRLISLTFPPPLQIVTTASTAYNWHYTCIWIRYLLGLVSQVPPTNKSWADSPQDPIKFQTCGISRTLIILRFSHLRYEYNLWIFYEYGWCSLITNWGLFMLRKCYLLGTYSLSCSQKNLAYVWILAYVASFDVGTQCH